MDKKPELAGQTDANGNWHSGSGSGRAYQFGHDELVLDKGRFEHSARPHLDHRPPGDWPTAADWLAAARES